MEISGRDFLSDLCNKLNSVIFKTMLPDHKDGPSNTLLTVMR